MSEYLVHKKKELNLIDSENPTRFSEDYLSDLSVQKQKRLPAELLILNRYGVGYPYLKAAWKLSQKHQITPFQVLIKSKVISLETWLEAQDLLANERKRIYAKRQQEALLLKQATSNLSDTLPHYSARQTFTFWQILFIIFCICATSMLLYIDYQNAIFAVFMFFALFYIASIFLRGLLLASFQPATIVSTSLTTMSNENLPVYSILVALYKEANQIEALTQSLWKLNWPKDKLEIKLICEADDHDTIETITDAKLPSCFELIRVPHSLPRTKPKALNYALPLCSGEYLVLYDAEDRPSPGQLHEAYSKFINSDGGLACLQAPLHIHNQDQNWLTAMFAIEYVTLFNGILPVLAKWRVPIPLGGTSNHFNGVR